MEINKTYCGHALDILRSFPDNFVDCIITSPPYWQLRNYGTEPIHWEDGSVCELGLEPTITDKHIDIEIMELKDNLTDLEKQYVREELLKCGLI